jgi:type I restriction enzyme S subunit
MRPMNVSRAGTVDLSVGKYVLPSKDVRRLRDGDVLFNNTNSPELVGKTAFVQKAGDWGFSSHMTRLAFHRGTSPR